MKKPHCGSLCRSCLIEEQSPCRKRSRPSPNRGDLPKRVRSGLSGGDAVREAAVLRCVSAGAGLAAGDAVSRKEGAFPGVRPSRWAHAARQGIFFGAVVRLHARADERGGACADRSLRRRSDRFLAAWLRFGERVFLRFLHGPAGEGMARAVHRQWGEMESGRVVGRRLPEASETMSGVGDTRKARFRGGTFGP